VELERRTTVFEAATKFRDPDGPGETIREAVERAAAEGDPDAKALLADNSLDIISIYDAPSP
jgi:hypothetical protein